MSSPRKLLRRALEALQQVDDLFERYPEARADVARRLGPDLLTRTLGVRGTLTEAVAALDAPETGSPEAGRSGPPPAPEPASRP